MMPHDLSSMHDAQPPLMDRYGRIVDYIRLSVTDRCDLRCQYCMGENMTFAARQDILTLEEILRLAHIFIRLGVNKIRITGGEPLVRHNVLWLMQRLGQLPTLQELTLTTNGTQLATQAPLLKAAGVRRINISLDSLDPQRFKTITRVGDLARVLAGIAATRKAGFTETRLNSVLMHGINDDEAPELVEFALKHHLHISFIEEMPLGEINHDRTVSCVSNHETLQRLQQHFDLLPSTHHTSGPARYWTVVGHDTQIGFISPHSHNFCASCNRVRITCKGELYLCLGQEHKVELLPLLRRHPDNDAPIQQAIRHGMTLKPEGHDFDLAHPKPASIRFMSMTGG